LKALLSGVLLALSFPPLPTGFLAYFGLIPFFFAIKQTGGMQRFRLGYIMGLVYCAGVMYWIAFNTGTYRWTAILSTAMAVAFIALNIAIFGWALGIILRRGVPGGWWWTAPLWLAIEYLRAFGTLSFPWLSLSLSQSRYLPVIQLASLTGMHGISFWVVLLNMGIFQYLQSRQKPGGSVKWAGVVIGIYLLPVLYGLVVLRTLPGHDINTRPVKVGIVQPNVDPNRTSSGGIRQSDYSDLLFYSTNLLSQQPDIILWPEAAANTYIRHNEFGYRTRVQQWVDTTGVSLLTGALDWETDSGNDLSRHYSNAAILFNPGDTTLQVYRKIKLVPFAEYIPFPKIFGFLYSIDVGQSQFTPGEDPTVLDIRSGIRSQFSVAICYDSTFPQLIRKFRKEGADWLAILTNDAWFGNTTGPYQHAEWARLRAVEMRMPVARAANTGISMLIDPWGRTQTRTNLNTQISIAGTLETGIWGDLWSGHFCDSDCGGTVVWNLVGTNFAKVYLKSVTQE